jgi:DNA-formamidopyrimidine glycosylase
MPEGVEVRIITNDLRSVIQHKELTEINILGGKYIKKNIQGCPDKFPITVKDVKCKGKFIYFVFSNGSYLFNTLGLSGYWTTKSDIKHNNVEFKFGKMSVFFNDMRNFGTLKFVDKKIELDKKLKELGNDMFEESTTFEIFKNVIMKKKKQNITKVLMNQKIISGIGNYIKSESLYRSEISPHRSIENLTVGELQSLYDEIKNVIKESYAQKGVKNYTESGDGTYNNSFKVYGQKKDPNGNLVKRFTSLDGRTTHWVESVQK